MSALVGVSQRAAPLVRVPPMSGRNTKATPAAAQQSTPAGPVYVEIRSSCPQTVKVFYGEKPKFGSGTYSSIDSNSVQSHSFQPGEQLWIVDDSENGISNATIGSGTRGLEINSSCTGISSR